MNEKSTGVKRRKYDASFKQEVLRLVSNGRPVSEVAQSLGIGKTSSTAGRAAVNKSCRRLLRRQPAWMVIAPPSLLVARPKIPCSLYINVSVNWSRKEIF